MIHNRIMLIPAAYGAVNMLATRAYTTDLVGGIEANIFLTAATFAPKSRFHKSSLNSGLFFYCTPMGLS